jgi:hypothetical protein
MAEEICVSQRLHRTSFDPRPLRERVAEGRVRGGLLCGRYM